MVTGIWAPVDPRWGGQGENTCSSSITHCLLPATLQSLTTRNPLREQRDRFRESIFRTYTLTKAQKEQVLYTLRAKLHWRESHHDPAWIPAIPQVKCWQCKWGSGVYSSQVRGPRAWTRNESCPCWSTGPWHIQPAWSLLFWKLHGEEKSFWMLLKRVIVLTGSLLFWFLKFHILLWRGPFSKIHIVIAHFVLLFCFTWGWFFPPPCLVESANEACSQIVTKHTFYLFFLITCRPKGPNESPTLAFSFCFIHSVLFCFSWLTLHFSTLQSTMVHALHMALCSSSSLLSSPAWLILKWEGMIRWCYENQPSPAPQPEPAALPIPCSRATSPL